MIGFFAFSAFSHFRIYTPSFSNAHESIRTQHSFALKTNFQVPHHYPTKHQSAPLRLHTVKPTLDLSKCAISFGAQRAPLR